MGEWANECRDAGQRKRLVVVMDSGSALLAGVPHIPTIPRIPKEHCCCTARRVPLNLPASQSNQRANFGRWKG
jgi:hypothetical protein